jgi:hypothetical protein
MSTIPNVDVLILDNIMHLSAPESPLVELDEFVEHSASGIVVSQPLAKPGSILSQLLTSIDEVHSEYAVVMK